MAITKTAADAFDFLGRNSARPRDAQAPVDPVPSSPAPAPEPGAATQPPERPAKAGREKAKPAWSKRCCFNIPAELYADMSAAARSRNATLTSFVCDSARLMLDERDRRAEDAERIKRLEAELASERVAAAAARAEADRYSALLESVLAARRDG